MSRGIAPIVFVAALLASAFAPCLAADSNPPFHIAGRSSRMIQKVTGLTFLGEFVADEAAAIAIRHKLGGKVKVHVKSYSLSDLLSGKFEHLQVETKSGAISGVPIGKIEVTSVTPLWYQYRTPKGHRKDLFAAVSMEVKASLTNEDVTKALSNPLVVKQMRGLRLDLPGLEDQQLQIINPHVSIQKDFVEIDALLITKDAAPETGVNIKVSGLPVLDGDKIFLKNLKVESTDIVEPERFASFVEQLINPVFNFSRLDRKDHAFRLKTLVVSDGSVSGTGVLVLAPRTPKVQALSTVSGEVGK